MMGIDPAEFVSITAEDISIISKNAKVCSGILAKQMSNIPAKSYSGFSKECLENFVDQTCAVFSSDGVPNVDPIAFGGIDDCIVYFSPKAVESITKEQAANLSNDACANSSTLKVHLSATGLSGLTAHCVSYWNSCKDLTAYDALSIRGETFGGFSKDCVADFSDDICNEVSEDQWKYLSPNAVPGLTESCVRVMNNNSFQDFTKEQVAKFSNDACEGITDKQIRTMSTDAFSGFTKDCISNLSDESCGGFSSENFQKLTVDAFSGIGSDCMLFLAKDDIFKKVTKEKIAVLKTETCDVMIANDGYLIDQLPMDSIAGFTSKCVSQWGVHCSNIAVDIMPGFTVSAMSGFTEECIRNAPDDFFSNVSPVQFAAFNSAIYGDISTTQMEKFNVDAYAGITEKFFDNVMPEVCSKFTPAGYALIPAKSFTKMSTQCFEHTEIPTLRKITKEQFSQFPPVSCDGFTKTMISSIPLDVIKGGLTTKCFENVPIDACEGLYTLNFDDPTVVSALTADCVNKLEVTVFDKLLPRTVANIPLATLNAIQFQNFRHIPSAAYEGFTPTQAKSFVPEGQCAQMDGLDFEYFSYDVIGALTEKCVAKFNTNIFENAFPKQVAAINPDVCRAFTADLLYAMDSRAYPGISADCMKNVPGDACSGFLDSGFQLLSLDVIKVFSPTCVNNLTSLTLEEMTVQQFNAIPSTSCKGFTSLGLSSIPIKVFTSVTPECVKNLELRSCDGIPTIDFQDKNVYTSIDPKCFEAAPANAFSYMTKEDMSILPLNLVSMIRSYSVITIPEVAFQGLDPSRAKVFKGCEPLEPEQFVQIRPESVAAMTTDCLDQIKPRTWANISIDQLNSLPANTCKSLSKSIVKSIPGTVFAQGMSSSCLAALDPLACNGIQSLAFGDSKVLTSINPKCVANLSCGVFGTLTDTLISQMPKDSIPSISICGIQSINEQAFKGFTPSQTSSFTKQQCGVFSPRQFANFGVGSTGGIAGLLPDCIGSFNSKNIFSFATSEQISTFHDGQCSVFTKDSLVSLRDNKDKTIFNGFTENCIKNFSNDVCVSIDTNWLNVLDVKKYAGFDHFCVHQWSVDVIQNLSIPQVNGLTNGIVGLCMGYAVKLTALLESLPHLPESLSIEAGSNLATGTCWNDLNDSMGKGELKPSIFYAEDIKTNLAVFFMDDKLVQTVIEKLNKDQMMGVREGHALHFTKKQIQTMTTVSAGELAPNVWLGINDDRISALSVDDISQIVSEFEYLSVGAIPYLTDAQLDRLNANSTKLRICYDQKVYFTPEMLNGRDGLAERVKYGVHSCPEYHYPLHLGPHKTVKPPQHPKTGINIWACVVCSLVTLVITLAVTMVLKKLKKSKKEEPVLSIGGFVALDSTSI